MGLTAKEQELRKLLDLPETIVFVGAGLSVWSGLPGWGKLIGQLIVFVEKKSGTSQQAARDCLQSGDFVGAADRLLRHIQLSELGTFLREDMGFTNVVPHRVHELATALGPTSFVTTNFDNLIEQQLFRCGHSAPRVISNQQLADLADVYRANARNFVFKVHGDINDVASLILTESQYQNIILGTGTSGISSVFKTLEILLATRPVLFIGYSLKDLDLSLVLRNLQNTFDRNAGTYWAIMPDLSNDEVAYLWETHRIRVFTYQTLPGETPDQKDHTPFVELLERLCAQSDASDSPSPTKPGATQYSNLLSFARYGTRLMNAGGEPGLEICAYLHGWPTRLPLDISARKFNGSPVTEIIAAFDASCVLSGPAGSGKSFAIRNHLAQQGEKIRDWALAEQTTKEMPEVPILVDARLYEGDFDSLIAASLPEDIDLSVWKGKVRVLLVVDSIDEMPARHLEEGFWAADLEKIIARFENCRIVFGTRRIDLIPIRDIAVFDLAPLGDKQIGEVLGERELNVAEISKEFKKLLRTPFVLRLASQFLRDKQMKQTAPSLFAAFVRRALVDAGLGAFADRALEKLQFLAFEANSTGRDTMGISPVEEAFSIFVVPVSSDNPPAARVIDRLVSAGLFVSEIDGRVRFIHRSVLEYLAGCELVRRYRQNNVNISELLGSRRWDNPFAWSVVLFKKKEIGTLVEKACQWDPLLALRMAHAAEVARDYLLNAVLDQISALPLLDEQAFSLGHEFGSVHFPASACDALHKLAESHANAGHGMLAGAAIAATLPHASVNQIRCYIDQLFTGQIDYNMGNHLGPALGRQFSDADLEYFLQRFGSAQLPDSVYDEEGQEDSQSVSIRHAISSTIGGLNFAYAAKVRDWSRNRSKRVRAVVVDALYESKHPDNRRYLVRQWELGVENASFALFLCVRSKWTGQDINNYFRCTTRRIKIMQSWLQQGFSEYRFELLAALCKKHPEWKLAVERLATAEPDTFLKKAFSLISPKTRKRATKNLLNKLAAGNISIDPKQLILLDLIDEQILCDDKKLLFALLETPNGDLLATLCQKFNFPSDYNIDPISAAEANNIIVIFRRWLGNSSKDAEYKAYLLSSFLVSNLGKEARNMLLRRSNDPKDPDRRVILSHIIRQMPSTTVSTDDLTPSTGNLLLETFLSAGRFDFFPSPGKFATERYVEDIVLPYAATMAEESDSRRRLELVLRDAGERHGRRYQPPWK